MNQMNNNDDFEKGEVLFEEEVTDSELHSKVNTDDHIYVDNSNSIKGRITFLIILSVILMLISIASAIFGFVFKDGFNSDRKIGVDVTEYNLFVTHSNSVYGGEIKSFSDHNSLEKAFTYSFYVTNNNPSNINYVVDLANLKFDESKIDMSLIKYNLIKNGGVVAEGNLENSMTNELYDTKISSDNIDKYEIKIWSDTINKKVDFVFKINIRV